MGRYEFFIVVENGCVVTMAVLFSAFSETAVAATRCLLAVAGMMVMASLSSNNMGWGNQFVNLMTMDYGGQGPFVC